MRKKYKLIFTYDGSEFFGWQRQTNTSETVQAKVEKAVSAIFKEDIKVVGSGRTDAKVHSLNQHVVFEAPFYIEEQGLVKGMNTQLPDSIRCIQAELLEGDFKPTNDAKSRTYIYLFSTDSNYKPFQRNMMAHFPFQLDIVKMEEVSGVFIGEHDFRSFMTTGSSVKTTTRSVSSVTIESCEEQLHGVFPAHYKLTIKANGFLKQMVRLIVGALVEVGKGKLSREEIEQALASADGVHIAPCAPPEGLFKYFVEY